jgi:1-acyl-sn-glycerol-3-phosphate acyltransferase
VLAIRSLVFVTLFYLWSVFWVLLIVPLVVFPRRWIIRSWRYWALGIFFLLKVICDIRVELRGQQHIPKGHGLIAPKHQCMLDVFAQFAWLPDSCFVTKKELMWIPFFGWYAYKGRMIEVDRSAQAAALRKMVADAKNRFADERQLVIFPEGTRGAPGRRLQARHRRPLPRARRGGDADGHQRRRPLASARLPSPPRDHRLRVPALDTAGPEARGVHAHPAGAHRDRLHGAPPALKRVVSRRPQRADKPPRPNDR